MLACLGADVALERGDSATFGQPGWDESQTLCEDVSLGPMRRFLEDRLDRFFDWGMDAEEAGDENRRLSAHLDRCLDFELHRRKRP